MPRGTCNYPEHHSPSAGPPFALLGAIALGAIIIAAWHAIVIALVVVAILACIAGTVFLLIHNHGAGYDPELERQAAAERNQAACAASYGITAAPSPAGLAADGAPALEAAPTLVHNHLHLHGVSPDDMAELAIRHQEQRPAIEEARPW